MRSRPQLFSYRRNGLRRRPPRSEAVTDMKCAARDFAGPSERASLWELLVPLAVAGCFGCSGGSSPPASTGSGLSADADTATDRDAAIAAVCVMLVNPPAHVDSCPIAPGAMCFGAYCGLDSLPGGLPCTGGSLCLPHFIDPCPDWQDHFGSETVDGYGCACVNGRWACGLCYGGGSICAADHGSASSDAGVVVLTGDSAALPEAGTDSPYSND